MSNDETSKKQSLKINIYKRVDDPKQKVKEQNNKDSKDQSSGIPTNKTLAFEKTFSLDLTNKNIYKKQESLAEANLDFSSSLQKPLNSNLLSTVVKLDKSQCSLSEFEKLMKEINLSKTIYRKNYLAKTQSMVNLISKTSSIPSNGDTNPNESHIRNQLLKFDFTLNTNSPANEAEGISPLCLFCSDIYDKPYSCYKCEAILCLKCFKKNIDAHGRCFICFNFIYETLLKCQEEIVDNLYKDKYLICPNSCCKQKFLIHDYKTHKEECIFRDSELYSNELARNTKPKQQKFKSEFSSALMEFYSCIYSSETNDSKETYAKGQYPNFEIENFNGINTEFLRQAQLIKKQIEGFEKASDQKSKESNKKIYDILYKKQ